MITITVTSPLSREEALFLATLDLNPLIAKTGVSLPPQAGIDIEPDTAPVATAPGIDHPAPPSAANPAPAKPEPVEKIKLPVLRERMAAVVDKHGLAKVQETLQEQGVTRIVDLDEAGIARFYTKLGTLLSEGAA